MAGSCSRRHRHIRSDVMTHSPTQKSCNEHDPEPGRQGAPRDAPELIHITKELWMAEPSANGPPQGLAISVIFSATLISGQGSVAKGQLPVASAQGSGNKPSLVLTPGHWRLVTGDWPLTGDYRDRTGDPLLAKQVLSQLS